ncbi:MAG TPA: hypothetical protein VHY09_04555 [Candidatus Methylacidiphilales bacterium]|jgi:hypothetical protein|nr:hypothetical protein [Candidatus Methylacidiphilales bacterium]
MKDVDSILKKLQELGLEDTKLIGQAVRDHLEELEEVAAYDEAKSKDEEIETLDAVLARYSTNPAS